MLLGDQKWGGPKNPEKTPGECVQQTCSQLDPLLTQLTVDHSNSPAWEQLIGASHTLTKNECVALIMEIFSDHNQVRVVVGQLSGNNAQVFIDAVDKVYHTVLSLKHNQVYSHSYPVG